MPARVELVERSIGDHEQRAKALVDEAIAIAEANPWFDPSTPEIVALREAGVDMQRSIVIALLARAGEPTSGGGRVLVSRLLGGPRRRPVADVPTRILGTITARPPFTRAEVAWLLDTAARVLRTDTASADWMLMGLLPIPVVAAERAAKAGGAAELVDPIRSLATEIGRLRVSSNSQAAKYRARLLALLAIGTEDDDAETRADPMLLSDQDTWGRAWRARLGAMRGASAAMVIHCSLADGVTPPRAWRAEAAELAHRDGVGAVLREMLTDALDTQSTLEPTYYEFEGRRFESYRPPVATQNAVVLRGLAWAAASIDEPWVDDTLTEIGLHFGTSGGSSNVARDERLANTAAAALGTRGTTEAIAGLGKLKARVTNRNVSKQIVKALDAAAASSGMPPSELLEIAVSPEGLDREGRREIPVGDYVGVLSVDDDDATLTWRAPDGRVTARPPVAIADRTADISRAKEALKDLRKAIGIERGRVEELFTDDREWPLGEWRTRYLEHPLTRTIAARLLWTVVDGDGRTAILPRDGELHDVRGEPVRPSDGARVRTWHPIEATDEEIGAWRSRLLELQLRQPFKQAFREVYRLTPAEEATDTYSNRFAAHILRYPQARALMTARRWGSNFLGPYDGGYNGIAKREFRTQGIRAEFWHDAVEEDGGAMGEVRHCTTDQVRFVATGPGGELLHLRDLPPIVFSEAMRDVDLFVSVTSVGADANWEDGWRERQVAGPFEAYFSSYHGEPLTATARVRRDALERMIPGLAIADRLTLEDRHLAVRGDLRSYRIHLGSGNIYMAPSDTYLCIVPARGGAASKVFLPFDDDPTLSVILSKAFLLAKDSRIKDPTIVRQLRHV